MKVIPVSKGIKYLGLNITKEVKDLHSENYKSLLKEFKQDKTKRSNPILMDWKTQYFLAVHTTQSSLQSQCNPCQIPFGIFY